MNNGNRIYVREALSGWWWIPMAIYGYALGLLIWWIRFQTSPTLQSVMAGIVLAFAIAACAAAVERFFPFLQRSEEGLRGYSDWGRRVEVQWSALGDLKVVSLWPWSIARVTSKSDGSRIWIPLFLADKNELLDSMADTVSVDHPLRALLQEQIA